MYRKQCSLCGKKKSIKNFYYQNKKLNKHMSACKICMNEIYKIKRRNPILQKRREILTKDFLKQKYIKEKLSTAKIGNLVGCDHTVINNHLRKHHIKIRNLKGINHPHYKDGRTLKKYFCVDCKKKVSYNATRCQPC